MGSLQLQQCSLGAIFKVFNFGHNVPVSGLKSRVHAVLGFTLGIRVHTGHHSGYMGHADPSASIAAQAIGLLGFTALSTGFRLLTSMVMVAWMLNVNLALSRPPGRLALYPTHYILIKCCVFQVGMAASNGGSFFRKGDAEHRWVEVTAGGGGLEVLALGASRGHGSLS